MNIRFKRIIINNFLSIGHADVELDEQGFTLVKGVNNESNIQQSNGSGKCFGPGTEVLMWDGTSKKVEDIEVNDIVMGWDSTPRIVLETHTGTDEMYLVKSDRNPDYSYTCNGEHILCLKKTIKGGSGITPENEYINISVNDWFNVFKEVDRRSYCQYIAPVRRYCDNPISKKLIPPYLLGLWLGDGSKCGPRITSADVEIKEYLEDFVSQYEDLHLKVNGRNGSKAKEYSISGPLKGARNKNVVLESLRHYNLIDNKHIPYEYLTSNYEDRLSLLAGLIDSDGYLCKKSKILKDGSTSVSESYEITLKDNQLVTDVINLSRSLGFKVTPTVKLNSEYGKYIRIKIYGDISSVPVLLERKHAKDTFTDKKHICYSLHPTITKQGVGKYYGFQISGDGMFLLRNGIVVHNSSIFDAILWTLVGETNRGTTDVTNEKSTDGVVCKLYFEVDGVEYSIIRSKGTKEYGNKLCFYCGEELLSDQIKKTQELIYKYVPVSDSQILCSIVLLGQGLPCKFTGLSPSKRKELLETMSGSSTQVDIIKSRLDLEEADLSSNINKFEGENSVSTGKISGYNSTILSLDAKIKSQLSSEEITEKISLEEEHIEAISKQIDEFLTKISDINDNIELIETMKENVSNTLYEKKAELNRCNSELSSIKTGVCPTCGRAYDISDEVQNKQESLLKEKEELTNLVNALTTKKLTVEEKYKNSKLEVRQLESNISSLKINKNTSESTIRRLSSLQDQTDTLLSQIQELKSSIVEEKASITKNSEVLEKLKLRLHCVQFLKRELSRDFKGYLLTDIINYVSSRTEYYSKYLFTNNATVSVGLDGNKVTVLLGDRSYENLSGGERQRVDMCVQFALRDMLVITTGFSCNILTLDEAFDNMDEQGCSSLINLIVTELTDIESIYIVTHHSEIDIPYDNQLVVVKNSDGISHIE